MKKNRLKKVLSLVFTIAIAFSLMPMVGNALAEGGEYGGQIQIVDAQTGKKIGVSGAEYQISDSKGQVLERVTTNATGSVYLKSSFDEAEYTIVTLTAPKGYALDSTERKYTVTKEDTKYINGRKTYVFEVNEQPIRGRFEQVDSKTGEIIKEAGSIFTIYDNNGKLFDTIVTNTEGYAELHKNLPYGNYMLKATKAPSGYFLNRSTINFKVSDESLKTLSNGSKLFTLTIQDEIIQGRLVAVEEDHPNNVIKKADSTYEIYDSEGRLFDTVKTDKDGVALFNLKLPYGKYTVVVTKAPSQFYKDPEAFAFEVLESDIVNENGERIYEVKFPHKAILVNVKIDAQCDVLTGVETVEENGFAVSKFVYGKDVFAGAKFSLIAAEEITLNRTKVFELDDIAGELTVSKEDNVIKSINLGKYVLKEEEIPFGFETKSENNLEIELAQGYQTKQNPTQTVELDYETRNTTVVFYAKAESMQITEDENGNIVSSFDMIGSKGFVYGLYTAEEFDMLKKAQNKKEKDSIEKLPANTLVATAVSDNEGRVVFSGQYPFGKYYIKELAAPEIFVVNTDVMMEFSNKTAESANGDINIELNQVEHPYKNLPVLVTAKTSDDKAISGARIEIKNDSGVVVFRALTSDNGVLENVKLIPGTYVAREISAGDGYEISKQEISFVVSDEKTDDVCFVSEETKYSLMVLDENGNAQHGVVFGLYKDGNEVDRVSSDENGMVEFIGFSKGSYQIKMIDPAEGYRKNQSVIEFEVGDEWLNSSVINNVTNDPEQIVESEPDPFHGGEFHTNEKIWIGVGAVIIVLGAAAAIVLVSRKKKKAPAAEQQEITSNESK